MGKKNAKAKAEARAKSTAEVIAEEERITEQQRSSREIEGQVAADPTSSQPMLIDVGPKQAKEIAKKAKVYRALLLDRQSILKKEVDLKREILSMIKEEHLKRFSDGSIQFRVDGLTITVTPRDELVKIKDDSDPDQQGD